MASESSYKRRYCRLMGVYFRVDPGEQAIRVARQRGDLAVVQDWWPPGLVLAEGADEATVYRRHGLHGTVAAIPVLLRRRLFPTWCLVPGQAPDVQPLVFAGIGGRLLLNGPS